MIGTCKTIRTLFLGSLYCKRFDLLFHFFQNSFEWILFKCERVLFRWHEFTKQISGICPIIITTRYFHKGEVIIAILYIKQFTVPSNVSLLCTSLFFSSRISVFSHLVWFFTIMNSRNINFNCMISSMASFIDVFMFNSVDTQIYLNFQELRNQHSGGCFHFDIFTLIWVNKYGLSKNQ